MIEEAKEERFERDSFSIQYCLARRINAKRTHRVVNAPIGSPEDLTILVGRLRARYLPHDPSH